MEPEKKNSFTPLPSNRSFIQVSTTLTKPESSEGPPNSLPNDSNKIEAENQHLELKKSSVSLPPVLSQKHWWTSEEDEKLQQLV